MAERVVVAMSGGVDSSVAAAMLVEQGFDVIGVTLRLFSCSDPATMGSCCDPDSAEGARDVAGQLGIPHYVLDDTREFEDLVLRPAWAEYKRGRTPNPCIRCNQLIKFGFLSRKARALGATRVATGHYARVVQDAAKLYISRGADENKDQSYVLFSLSRGQRDQLLLPLGELTKQEVRGRARKYGLSTANNAESQDACLRDDEHGFAEALRRRVGTSSPRGEIVDITGRVLGPHDGIHKYTIGQRRRLGISIGYRAWVVAIQAQAGRVVVSADPRDLSADGLRASEFSWYIEPPAGAVRVHAQLGAHLAPVSAVATTGPGGSAIIRFDEPQKAVTPGQAAVLYEDDRVIGGGWIEYSIPLRARTVSSSSSHDRGSPTNELVSGSGA